MNIILKISYLFFIVKYPSSISIIKIITQVGGIGNYSYFNLFYTKLKLISQYFSFISYFILKILSMRIFSIIKISNE